MNVFRNKFTLIPIIALVILLLPQVSYAEGNIISDAVLSLLWYFVVGVFGMLVRLGALLLDAGIDYFVIGFGSTFANSGVGVAVNNTWVIIRDFVNLGFIFGLVYIGFKMILGSDTSNTRRWLVNLIIAALLVNFSLFATKFVVDFSNQISFEVAKAGLGADCVTKAPLCQSGVGQKFMNRMGITTVLGTGEGNLPDGASWGYIFGTAILFIVTAFVFAAGGILLIIRFAVLNLFLVLSPIMFVSWVIPALGDTMSRYWRDFLKRCFFAPVYLVFIYFSFQIIGGLQTSIRGAGEGNTATSLAAPNYAKAFGAAKDAADIQSSSLGTLPFFVLIIVFMVASLVAANKLGADGAAKAISIGKKARDTGIRYTKRTAGTATVGAAAYAGRGTLGRAAYQYAQSDKAKDRAARSAFGKVLYGAAKKTGDASFDARRVGGLGKELGIGEGQKGGYAKQIKDAKDNAKKFYGKDGLGFVDVDSVDGKRRVSERETAIKLAADEKERKARIAQEEFAEDRNQSEVTLTAAITALTTQIESQEKELEEGITNGAFTEVEKKERTAAIDEQKLRLNAKNENLETVKVKDEWLRQRRVNDNVQRDSSATVEQKTQAREEFQKAEAAYAQAAKERDNAITQQKSEAAQERNNANKAATAEVKYSRQIDYMKKLQQSQKRWDNVFAPNAAAAGSGFGAATLASGLGAAALGVGALYTLPGAVAVNNQAAALKEIIKDIDKEYGKGGVKQIQKEQRIKEKQERAAAEADLDIGGDKKAAEGGGDDKK